MRVMKKKSTYAFCAMLLLFIIGSAYGSDNSAAGYMLPEDIVIEDIFKPGLGAPVGRVQLVQGEVVLVHGDMLHGFRARRGLPLYKGDTIYTQEKGRMRFNLNDGSKLTLASKTKLVINRSIYKPKEKRRASFMGLNLGKARFWVKKMINFKRSAFKVKTPTAVCGVRGSDFIIRATPEKTTVTALEDTELEIVSLTAPEEKPTLLSDFERTVVEKGELPDEVDKVSAEEVVLMMKEFVFSIKTLEPEGKLEGKEGKAATKEVADTGTYLPESALSEPEEEEDPDKAKTWSAPDYFKIIDTTLHEDTAREIADEIPEQAIFELPSFPGTP